MIDLYPEFICSTTEVNKCPSDGRIEYAFIGRSNVGKSSLINAIVNKKIAKTSSLPGKTRLMNYFLINNEFYFVDLPGLGYAQRSKDEIRKWQRMIREYILNRKTLVTLFMLIDIRIPIQKIDLDFMLWLGINKIPFVIIFTKIDKLSKNELGRNLFEYKKELEKYWSQLPNIITTSSKNKNGIEEIKAYIKKTNEEIKNIIKNN